jgi:hypothetical protein
METGGSHAATSQRMPLPPEAGRDKEGPLHLLAL